MTTTTTMLRRRLMLVFAATALLLASCGGGADRTKAQVRLVNASAYPALDLRVDNSVRQGGVGYGATANTVEVEPNEPDVAITQQGSATALLSLRPALAAKKHYTVLAYGNVGALRHVVLDENQGQADNNRTALRVLNGAADAGPLDVYLTGTDDALATAVPVQSGAAFGTLGASFSHGSGSWRLRVTAAGDKDDVRLDVTGVVLPSRGVATLVLASGSGGMLVDALLVQQQGAITRHDNTATRVRAVHGLAAANSVQLSAAGRTLLNLATPAATTYVNVPAGTVTPQLSVNGTTRTAPALTLNGGADVTLLVHGEPATAALVALADDNRIPAGSNQVRVRLVNGVAGAVGGLTLTVDFAPLAQDVAAGAASGYGTVTANASADLQVTSAGSATPLFTANDHPLVAGGVYTVFVVGSAQAPVGFVRRDR